MTFKFTSPQALQCRECGQQYAVEPLTICEECFGPLEPTYDLQSIDGEVFRKQAESGPRTLWRYESLLPGGPGIDRIDLGAGFTPLRRAANLGERLGLETLWIKDDSVNPNFSPPQARTPISEQTVNPPHPAGRGGARGPRSRASTRSNPRRAFRSRGSIPPA